MPLQQRGISLTISTAFVALIVLICGLVLNSLLQLQALNTQMSTVVETHNRKIDLITQTQVASHLRTDSLFRMVLAGDPFERDAYFMEFNRAGFLVGSGRNALRLMGFTPDEQLSFDAQTRLVNEIETIQEQVVDLINADRSPDARRVLLQQAIPSQAAFNLQLANMRDLYQQANVGALRRVKQSYQRTFLFTLAFSSAAIALALLIAWRTLHKARLRSQLIHEQMVELERSRTALRKEATRDPLTGLANRRLFYDRLHQAVRHARRYGGKLGVLYVDLDRFKEINDRHGHHVGDAVLTEVAKRLTASIRGSDSAARLGGDEFVVLLEEVQGREDCIAAARKIELAVNADTRFYGIDVEIDVSIGHALYPDDGSDEDALIRAADASMYRAKSGYECEQQQRLPF